MEYKLRELSRSDLTLINAWRNNEKLISFLGAPFRYIDKEIDEMWFENYLKNRNNTVRCSIVDENNIIIGLISLTDINYINRTAILHIMIGEEKNQNKGVGSFAIVEMVKHSFNNLNLNRIQLEVLSDNLRAITVYKKIGFREEGLLRQAYYKNGKYVDVILMAILKNDIDSFRK